MGHTDTAALREEDSNKTERLERLNELIGLPYDRAYKFPCTALVRPTPEFKEFLRLHGSELCVLRLNPLDPRQPKLRMRGHTIRDALAWFSEQQLDPSKYRAVFAPHSDNNHWATIFVLNRNGVFGEIVYGTPAQLTQGFYEDQPPITFSWDFRTFKLDPANSRAERALVEILKWLKVDGAVVREQLATELDSKFTHHYLHGYFETWDSAEYGMMFIDYNRILGRSYETFRGQESYTGPALVTGHAGSSGKVRGKVRLVPPQEVPTAILAPGEILVCRMTTPDYLPLMQQAGAIVTDLGGVLSHAAIVARELHKPCLTATGNATQLLHSGQTVTVDADAGVVRAP
jgi:phosphohistidine swiveling domain-containing protein